MAAAATALHAPPPLVALNGLWGCNSVPVLLNLTMHQPGQCHVNACAAFRSLRRGALLKVVGEYASLELVQASYCGPCATTRCNKGRHLEVAADAQPYGRLHQGRGGLDCSAPVALTSATYTLSVTLWRRYTKWVKVSGSFSFCGRTGGAA